MTFKPKLISHQGSHTFELFKFHDFQFTICKPSIIYLVCPPPPPPKLLYNLCYSFLLNITVVSREIKNISYAKLLGGGGGGGKGVGAIKVYY